MSKHIKRRRLVARRGAVIVEFALVVPFLALIVFGVIDFSRAYGQMNVLDSALREGARAGSEWKDYAVGDYRTAVKNTVQSYATTYGFNGLDLTKVSVNTGGINNEFITVTVTAHPIPLATLSRFMPVPALTLTRSVTFRWRCAGSLTGACPP
jgi:Flp pilus assembly protein TadG